MNGLWQDATTAVSTFLIFTTHEGKWSKNILTQISWE